MDYLLEDARFTMILLRREHLGEVIYERVPMDLVRFDVDTNPSAQQFIMPVGNESFPVGGVKPDSAKRFEKIWIVDGAAPFREKTWFGNQGI